MKTGLSLRASQHLALTPQLQQSIKLLQLSTVEMQQEIERYLLENPMLEREDDQGGESFASAQQFDSPRNEETRSESSEEREPREEHERDNRWDEMGEVREDPDDHAGSRADQLLGRQ